MRMMIAWELVFPSRLRQSPLRCDAKHPERHHQIGDPSHSLRTASAISNRPARQAGIHPAAIAAAIIQTGVQASDHHGKASWIVHPKKARLITPVSTNDRHNPEAT